MKKLAFLSAGVLALVLQQASAQVQVLFTTTNDFGGWSGNNGTTAGPSTAWDGDGSTINGLGNNGNAGGGGAAGSLGIQGPPSYNWTDVAWSPGEAWLPLFMHAIDPGSLAAWSAESGWGPGQTVAYSGTMQMLYTIPDNEGGSYFDLGIGLNYDGNWNAFFPSTITSLGTIGGQETVQATIPYYINAHSLTYFSVGIMYNSDYAPVLPFYVDQIQVPEPGAMALMSAGFAALMLIRRRLS